MVYAAKEGTVIWSDHTNTHKAGRVPLHEPLTVIKANVGSHHKIARPDNLSLPHDPIYPHYYVKRSDVVDSFSDLPIDPPADPGDDDGLALGDISDNDAAIAMIVILKWFKQQ